MEPVLEVVDLQKSFGGAAASAPPAFAVAPLSFTVAPGEIVGLLGPNGAGKTTTIHMILGVLAPDGGTIRIAGQELGRGRTAALERTNFAAVYAPLPGNLTVEQNLRIFGMFYGVPDLDRRIDATIDELGLGRWRRTRCGVLSSGEQTRVALAKALLNDPPLLLLDEPTASLDRATARDVRAILRAWVARGTSGVLWTSHNMQEVAEVCDRVLMLSKGRVVLDGDPRTLPAAHGEKDLEELFITVAREPSQPAVRASPRRDGAPAARAKVVADPAADPPTDRGNMAARLRRVAAIALRQLYLMRSSVTRVLPLFVWVAIDMVLWGFLTRWLDGVARPGFEFVPTLLGAVLLWDFFTRVMHGVTTAFFEDVWSRNFLNVFASPLRISEYVTGLVLTSIVTSAVGLAVMVALAGGVFGLDLLRYGALLVPFLLVLFLFGIALGVFGCAVVLRLGPAAEWFIWPIPALVSPFAGVFYPVATLPAWMQGVARLLPPSYVFESLRTIVQGGRPPLAPLLGSAALALLYVVAAGFCFARVHRGALRSGLLARYSAESVN